MKMRILAALWVALHAATDGEKLTVFFDKTIKNMQQKVKRIKANQSSETIKHEELIEDLNEQIEDAEQALENSYIEIPEDALKSNASMNDFQDEYFANIEHKQELVDRLKKLKEDAIESFNKKMKSSDESIAKFEALIAKLSEEEEVKKNK